MNTDLLNKFGERIRYLRHKKNWTIEDLAFEAGINKNYIGDLERGKRNPTLKIIKRVADALEVSLLELFKDL